jgi:uncharacterized protein YfaS (alpha-2-macroglobulin family)
MKGLDPCHTNRRLVASAVAAVFVVFLAACHPGAPVIKTSAVAVDGTIAGLVHATDNAIALDGRKVTAVEVNTGTQYETTTGPNGGYTIKVPAGTYRLEVETRSGERLATQPGQTHVKSGDLDAGRDFDVVVTTTAHP